MFNRFSSFFPTNENIFPKINNSREHEILNHNEEYNTFFDHLMALLAESIATIPIAGKIIIK